MAILFQSTLPAGEATRMNPAVPLTMMISIHASRGGSDVTCHRSSLKKIFQSTLPAGEATRHCRWLSTGGQKISIHASRGGSDREGADEMAAGRISIHASRGGSDDMKRGEAREIDISIHASRGGSDPVM